MSLQISTEHKPQLNPHPLSPYVAWAGHRNRDPILQTLKSILPTDAGQVLELASGSGMHLHYFAPHFPQLHFQPSDLDVDVFDNIRQLTQDSKTKNVSAPVQIDLTQLETWSSLPKKTFDAIFCINIFQVAPVSIAAGMMQCAAELLTDGGLLFIYGPFKINGECITDSNTAFDQTLRSHDVPEWGLKDIADLTQAAKSYGLRLEETLQMPANNFGLIYKRASKQ